LSDHFAIVGVNKIRGKIAVRTIKTWIPENGQKVLFSNPTNKKSRDIEYPFGYIRHLCSKYNVQYLYYDPYQAEKLAQDLTRERIVACKPFSQQSLRNKADKHLLDLIRDRDIIHNGNETLTEHIQNAHLQNKGENKMRIVKGSQSSKKIDAAVALSMAAYGVKDLRLK